ncbi:unnamed protein product [Phytomonas sp. EM1]|nr:unnamed protein product [Phytomonas sp. EM1]|eukprot:CCW65162.1 unnamed protein product [Phytomonas sp. isolate EM1]
MSIDTYLGAHNIEEVILSWMRGMYLQAREIREDDNGWLCDPNGRLVRLDRYTFYRFEHDGIRFFIGVTMRSVGQQQRIEKMLGELNAMEKREQPPLSSTDRSKDVLSINKEIVTGLSTTDLSISRK